MAFARFCSVALTLGAVLLSISARAAEQASCSFDTFPAPSGYTLSMVEGVGDDGTVVGQLTENKTQASMAFLRAPNGHFTIYSAPKSASTWLYGQNASSTSDGTYMDSGSSAHLHGFFLVSGKFTAVNYPNASNTWLFGLNQVGSSVGSYSEGTSTKGFLLVNGKYTTIAYPNEQATYPMAVNDNNAVVGYYPKGFAEYGFLWQNGKFTEINFPNSKYGTGLTGINNSGVIVGNHISADKAFGFMYENETFKNIVYSGALFTLAGGINNNGLVAGQIYMTWSNTLGYTATCK
jgi:uncharacterized membrane protein